MNGAPAESRPLVTVIVPIFNEARFLDKCLGSIQVQDYPPDRLEFMLVDGGSTDGTREKLAQFVAGRPGYQLLSNPRRVQPAAMNIGITGARGDVIIRFDAHVEYPPDFISTCVSLLAQTGADVVGGRIITQPGGDGVVAQSIAICGTSRFGMGGARFRVGGRAGYVDTVPFGAYRRTVFNTIGLFNENLPRAEDNEFNGRMRAAGMKVYYDPRIVSTYYSRSTLSGFVEQQFGNGSYHLLTALVSRKGCSPRHLVPFLFVSTLLALLAAGAIWPIGLRAAAAVFGLYLLVNLVVSASLAVSHGWLTLLVLPWIFPLIHVAYGLATLIGGFRYALPFLARKILRRPAV